MTTLITGGAKCGKSHYAEHLLDAFTGQKIYIATMQPFGEEAHMAIERHRRIRAGKGFETVERYTDLSSLELPQGCGVLLECIANLCANEMFLPDGSISDPTERVLDGVHKLQSYASELVIVTNEVGSDGVDYAEGTAGYIRAMGAVNAGIAAMADDVIECVYGIPVAVKGCLR